ncbi:hypothetical protein [Algoriphagus sp. AK58]|uniref:hypothetical protein n=1 Tax=Algoriphagus sp. AK58 TaxID=1406877 RepID=UPI0016500365|nr:hypothetical protein [Algoriphagus sp. AK58]MBC6366021.1 hypothetical protein [Algoriphagus sp. AK58]
MKKFYVFTLLLFSSTHLSFGQSKKVYEGNYIYLGKSGEASFEFILNSDFEQIKDGRFYFQFEDRKDNGKSEFFKRSYSGFFSADSREGDWEIEEENLFVKISDIIDLKVNTSLSGIQTKILASYKAGLPEGSWTFQKRLIEDGQVNQSIQSDRIFFKKGKLANRLEFRISNGKSVQFAKGEVQDEGVMSGEWTLVYLSEDRLVNEVRNYENGFLLGLVKRDLKTGEILDEAVFFDTIEKLNLIRQGSQAGFRIADEYFGLEYADGFLSSDSLAQIQKDGNDFLKSFLGDLLAHDPNFIDQNGNVIFYPIHTRRMVYELSRSDQKMVEEMPHRYEQLKDLFEKQLNDPAFRLNRFQNDSLALAYRFFEVQNKKLEKLKELVELIKTKQIQYYDLNGFAGFVSAIFVEKEEVLVKVDEKEKAFSFQYPKRDFETDFYSAFQLSLEDIRAKADQFLAYSGKTLTVLRENEELLGLSKSLDLKRMEVLELYEDSSGENALVEALKERFLVQQMELEEMTLAKIEGFEKKKVYYQRIELLLDSMKEIYGQLGIWTNQEEELDRIYLEEIFNPFTYTKYNQRVKPRLFESYELLFSHYLTSFSEETDYTNLKVWISKAEKLGERIRKLRNEDTRKLEKSLNKAKTISKLESLLGL